MSVVRSKGSYGTLVMDEVGTPVDELMKRVDEAHFRFWYWLILTEDEWEIFV